MRARARSRASSARVPDASSRVVFATLVAHRHPRFTFAHPDEQSHVEFGEGLLNKGRAKKREKRPLTQIEIMAAVEREKQEKKAARRAAKVRASLPTRKPDACRVSTKRRKRRARFPEIFTPRLLGLFPVSHARGHHRFEDEKESLCFRARRR